MHELGVLQTSWLIERHVHVDLGLGIQILDNQSVSNIVHSVHKTHPPQVSGECQIGVGSVSDALMIGMRALSIT